MSDPLVSVIIPTYYREEQLEHAIESVLSQEYENIELIVVDDSGEGFARETVEKHDVDQYIEFEKNKGDNIARNTGIECGSGEYFQFLDDDDELYPSKLTKQMRLISNRNTVGAVYSGLEWESRIQLPDTDVKGEILDRALALDTGCCNYSSLLVEMEILREIIPLKQQRPSDFVTIIELAQETCFDYVDEPLVSMGESPDSAGSSMEAAKGREQLIHEYSDLYEDFDDEVKKEALKNMNTVKGMTILRNETWSPKATTAFARACYHSFNMKRLMRVIASLFGLPGFKLAGKVHEYSSRRI
jgi:glycosyltransferase involved in cell wall biosynthesis